MSNNCLSKEGVSVFCYAPPVCEVIFVESQKVICASGGDPNQGTEIVDEIEGIW